MFTALVAALLSRQFHDLAHLRERQIKSLASKLLHQVPGPLRGSDSGVQGVVDRQTHCVIVPFGWLRYPAEPNSDPVSSPFLPGQERIRTWASSWLLTPSPWQG